MLDHAAHALLALALLASACGESHEPSSVPPTPRGATEPTEPTEPTAEPTEAVDPTAMGLPPLPTAPALEAVPTSTAPAAEACPEHIRCHATWSACLCALTERGDVERMEADFDGDGALDLRLTYLYDAEGNLLRWENDRGADGSVETPCTFNPPCPPPHPNAACNCFGPQRSVTQEEARRQIREAGDRATEIDPAEAQRMLGAGQ